MKTLLTAIDFSDATPAIMDCAQRLAKTLGAKLLLVHVIEPITNFSPIGPSMDVIETALPELIEADNAKQKEQLALATTQAKETGLEVSADTLFGLAAEEIVNRAAVENAEFILLGSHGHGALYHLFAGSVVTGVLKRTKIPVIVIPVEHR